MPTEPPEAPPPAVENEAPQEPNPFHENTYVSTAHNEEAQAAEAGEPEAEPEPAAEFAVTSPEAAKSLAEAAVAEQLDPEKEWRLSPVLPAQWPSTERAVAVFFYPLAPNPPSLTEFRVFSAAYRVTVSLTDGATTVDPIKKRRKLGTIKETRVSALERRELEMAEDAMVRHLLDEDIDKGSKPYWGYLKYVHEHDEIGGDLKRRAPAFFSWLKRKHGR